MDSGYTGFLFLSMFVIITVAISFRWCCKRMRQYDEMMRGIEEEQEQRRRVAEDMWIFSVQHGQSPQALYGDTQAAVRGQQQQLQQGPPPNYNAADAGKPPDELPSYEEALKLPALHPKDTTNHV